MLSIRLVWLFAKAWHGSNLSGSGPMENNIRIPNIPHWNEFSSVASDNQYLTHPGWRRKDLTCRCLAVRDWCSILGVKGTWRISSPRNGQFFGISQRRFGRLGNDHTFIVVSMYVTTPSSWFFHNADIVTLGNTAYGGSFNSTGSNIKDGITSPSLTINSISKSLVLLIARPWRNPFGNLMFQTAHMPYITISAQVHDGNHSGRFFWKFKNPQPPPCISGLLLKPPPQLLISQRSSACPWIQCVHPFCFHKRKKKQLFTLSAFLAVISVTWASWWLPPRFFRSSASKRHIPWFPLTIILFFKFYIHPSALLLGDTVW